MIVGVPKEIKNHEYRVGMTPAGVHELVEAGHTVLVQEDAGLGAGFDDRAYREVGGRMMEDAEDVFDGAQLIVKVKEPQPSEYSMINEDHIIFTYFHFAASQDLTEAMLDSKSVCVAYETIQSKSGGLPLLSPMSRVAGRMAVQEGAAYLAKPRGGSGVLLGGVAGVKPGKVVILGAGTVGTESAKIAAGLGAEVVLLDINVERLNYLDEVLPDNVSGVYSNKFIIEQEVPTADLLIGAVLVAGAKAPSLVAEELIKQMKPGSVVVDVAVDQGGCIDTCKPTIHEDPTYVLHDVIHYGVANIPGAVPLTSTAALTNATLPYVLKLASGGQEALRSDEMLKSGVNVENGRVTNKSVADAFGMEYHQL